MFIDWFYKFQIYIIFFTYNLIKWCNILLNLINFLICFLLFLRNRIRNIFLFDFDLNIMLMSNISLINPIFFWNQSFGAIFLDLLSFRFDNLFLIRNLIYLFLYFRFYFILFYNIFLFFKYFYFLFIFRFFNLLLFLFWFV